ncbi:MAG: alpha/beta hydrolase [Elusimicrobiota bacterium]
MSEGRARAALGVFFFGWALLAVFRAPTYHLWLFALVATEWGHWLAFPALLTWAPGWHRTRGGQAGAVLGLCAALLFVSPVARAARAFGLSASRPAPLVFADLWLGVHSPPVRESAELYARGCGENLYLQLYRPVAAAGPLPVVLVVHGGSWQSGSRLEMPELSRYLAARGYAVASIDYGLAPRTVFPGPVDDLRDAADFLRAHAAEWSLDMSRVVLLGRSAGAQIVLAAAASDDPIPGVRGVVDFYGPNDMRLAWTVPGSPWILDSRQLLLQYLGGSPSEVPGRYDEASALLRAGPKFPPTLMIHGSRDELVWPLHELRLSARLTALGVPHEYLEIPWGTHGCDYAFSGPCGQVTTYTVERFLGRVLR